MRERVREGGGERESCIFQSTSREMQRDVLDNHRTLKFADMWCCIMP